MSRRKNPEDQIPLFDFAPPEPPRRERRGVAPAPVSPEAEALGRALPHGCYLGVSTWSFPGWAGLVYDDRYAQGKLAREGLAAYAQHPLFRAVGIDRTHYSPADAEDLAESAAMVPQDFRFLVKAHEVCTLARFPDRPRYGSQRGQANSLFLDVSYTADQVVAPYVEGLGDKGGALLFQFAPQDLGTPERFADALQSFLTALPRGPRYAVELRNRELLTPAYADALASAAACHCHNVHPRMPDVRTQARLAQSHRSPVIVGRWLLAQGMAYEQAGRLYEPFDKLVAPDPGARRSLAELARETLASGREFLLTVNNNAEGCSPLSIQALAREIVGMPTAPAAATASVER
ncbi:MAG TPA: DUF72 domain-containing protein [Thermoanaerobaculia bacterium]|nr:DUF72 domain-containing protein [Thermoanaerobaculia bacterium]